MEPDSHTESDWETNIQLLVHHLTLFVKIVQSCRKGYETEVTKMDTQ